jgi:hypothetical protein
MTGVAKGTVTRFLVALGRACDEYQDAVLRDLPCKRVQADEIWAFVYAKQRNIPKRLTGPSVSVTHGHGPRSARTPNSSRLGSWA